MLSGLLIPLIATMRGNHNTDAAANLNKIQSCKMVAIQVREKSLQDLIRSYIPFRPR